MLRHAVPSRPSATMDSSLAPAGVRTAPRKARQSPSLCNS